MLSHQGAFLVEVYLEEYGSFKSGFLYVNSDIKENTYIEQCEVWHDNGQLVLHV